MKATINGVALNVDVSGPATAPAVVLHHPLATNLSGWDELTAALNPSCRVVRFDARGHGLSDAPKGAYTFEALSADVVGLMDHLKISQAHYLGLSMGGMVGQYLGLLHPDRFRSLCLVSTTSEVPAAAQPLWEERIRNAGTLGMDSVVEGALPRWVAPQVVTGNPDLVQRLVGMIRSTPPDGYIGWCEAIRRLNVTSRLKQIRLPTRVIVGALDPGTPPAAAQVIANEIAGSDLIIMPGVSHMLHMEQPGTLAGHVLEFLRRRGSSA